VFGLNFDQSEEWRLSASLQFSEVEEPGIAFERTALSLGSYVEREDLKLSSRVEYREDKGSSVETRQYVSSNSFTHIASRDWRWLGQLNLSWTDDELNGGRDARFVEFDLGYAWRPAAIERSAENDCTGDNDCARKRSRWNVIGKYAFLYDLPSEGQATNRPDEKSHLLSIEGIYDLNNRWELAAKLAIKRGSLRLMRDSGPWIDFGPRLASIRARYHLTHKLDGLAEYRWVTDTQADTNRHGALLGIYQHVGDNFKIGVGYNFTDFDDRLRIDRYENHGWFVDFVGKY
jgi:hypothetical protein